MQADKDLQQWSQEIVELTKGYAENTAENLERVLSQADVKLHKIYQAQIQGLSPEDRAAILAIFREFGTASPDRRRELYAQLARSYERFLGWENGGNRDRGLRSWI